MQEIIRLNNLNFSYGKTATLKNISLSIKKGNIVGILGSNGSGKSTLLKTIFGHLKPKSGEIIYRDKPLTSYKIQEIAKRISYTPQNPIFSLPITVLEAVLIGRAPYIGNYEFENAKDIEIAFDSMNSIGIIDLKNRYVNQLSGGEKQLVSIARALAQEPEVMVLDEPTTFLDFNYKTRILNLISSLNKDKGITIIIATHDISYSISLFDQIVLLKYGAIYDMGEKSDVINEETLSEVYGIDLKVLQENGTVLVIPKQQNQPNG